MSWTDSRSREDWLAEVRRRGERIRRRRRFTLAVVGAFALVLPLSTIAGYLVGPPQRAIELSVAGRAPADATTPTTTGSAGTTQSPPLVGAPSPTTTTTEVHRPGPAGDGPGIGLPTPSSIPPADNPVVARAEPLVGAPTSAARAGSAGASEPAPKPLSLPPCTPSEVKITVTTDKAVYAPGEPVSGTFKLEKLAASNCLLERVEGNGVHTRSTFRFEDPSGRKVGVTGESTTFSSSITAPEVEKSYTRTFAWDQKDSFNKDCSVILCLQVPDGTYTVVAEWGGEFYGEPKWDGGPFFNGQASFRIGA